MLRNVKMFLYGLTNAEFIKYISITKFVLKENTFVRCCVYNVVFTRRGQLIKKCNFFIVPLL